MAVAVRPGAPWPYLSSAAVPRHELLAADSRVSNRASAGAHIETVLICSGFDQPPSGFGGALLSLHKLPPAAQFWRAMSNSRT